MRLKTFPNKSIGAWYNVVWVYVFIYIPSKWDLKKSFSKCPCLMNMF